MLQCSHAKFSCLRPSSNFWCFCIIYETWPPQLACFVCERISKMACSYNKYVYFATHRISSIVVILQKVYLISHDEFPTLRQVIIICKQGHNIDQVDLFYFVNNISALNVSYNLGWSSQKIIKVWKRKMK